MKFPTHIAIFLLYLGVGYVAANQSEVLSAVGGVNSVTVNFEAIEGALLYQITVTPLHDDAEPKSVTTTETTHEIQELKEFTWYYVNVLPSSDSVKAGVGSTVKVRTLPRAWLRLGTPFTDSVDVFLNMKYSTAVTQWVLQYRKTADAETKTETVDDVYSYRIATLMPATEYQIRARPSMLYGTDPINFDEDALYTEWISFTTATSSIFGSVVLPNEAYTSNHREQDSDEWKRVFDIVAEGYASLPNYEVTLLRIENNGDDKCRVHYRLKETINVQATAKQTDFSLTGGNFAESFINNGGKANGTTYVLKDENKWTLIYVSETSCSKIVERFMVINLEDGSSSLDVHLNVASSDATTPGEQDSLRVESNGDLVTDDEETIANVPLNKVLVLTPRFLIKDCLTEESSTPLYSEFFEATLASTTPTTHFTRDVTITGTSPDLLNVEDISYTTLSDGTSVTLSIPAVPKAIKYEVLIGTTDENSVLTTLEEKDIDNSKALKATVNSLVAGKEYEFVLRVSTRGLTEDDAPLPFKTKSFVVKPTAKTASVCLRLK